jgi:hypothetical protein
MHEHATYLRIATTSLTVYAVPPLPPVNAAVATYRAGQDKHCVTCSASGAGWATSVAEKHSNGTRALAHVSA